MNTILWTTVGALTTLTVVLAGLLLNRWLKDHQTAATLPLEEQLTRYKQAIQQADQMLQERGQLIVALAIKTCGQAHKTRIPAALLKQAAEQAVNVTPRKDGGYELTLVEKPEGQ
ncbi:MAG: hypothetical protein ABIJ75_05745 [Actinomycetota bacterium]